MRPVDYDARLHRGYAQGRALSAGQRRNWAMTFASRLPPDRPLRGVDVGSGIGRFTPLLAEEFGGPITGVEPSVRMREQALSRATHPRVDYRAGRAESLPLPDACADFALCFLVWHHVRDKAAAARELRRVIRPGGTFLLRSDFTDHLPDLWWIDAFPRGPEVHEALYQPLADVLHTLEGAGWRYVALDAVTVPSPGTRADMVARLRTRSFSVFEYLSEDDIQTGFAELERRVAADPDSPTPPVTAPLLTLRAA